MNGHYDFIIIGTGAGGGTLAYKLAASGKRILILERGTFLPREKQNWSSVEVFQKDRYHTSEVWYDKNKNAFHPGTGYWVGGNTKVYGAALLRFREKDFRKVIHKGGVSPEWPLSYCDFEPYYAEAERLYQVHGQQGDDPTEPFRSSDFPYPAVSHEPRIQEINDALVRKGLRPFHLPLGVRLNETDRFLSKCIRCDTCDGYPCLVDAKADSDVTCVRPALRNSNVTLLTEAHVKKLLVNPSGREVTGVDVVVKGEAMRFSADIVVVACGAINSAVLLLRSASDKHPRGLANGSDQVGRNFMRHINGAILGLTAKPNPTQFQKTMAINDWYWGEPGFDYPMGHVQLLGKLDKDTLQADAPAFAPGLALEQMASHSVAWWLTAEDLPHPDNRVWVHDEHIHLDVTDRYEEHFQRLMKRFAQTLKEIDCGESIIPHGLYFRKKIPLQAVGHQCGTCRFGDDPKTSVLDINCQAHEIDNLYVVDGSFFPSSGAVNPSLTIMANALRVGDHLLQRVGAKASATKPEMVENGELVMA